jgi:hypothetical protein
MKYTVIFVARDSMSLRAGFSRKAHVAGLGLFAKTEILASVQAASFGKCGIDLMRSLKRKKQSAGLVAGASGFKRTPRLTLSERSER